ncbi:MAG: polyprenyl synthetase family protein, partial [Clostridiales bacterium]|nr:polyprenyl synthetase family protein [Clostridiales bacterium]
ILAGDALLSFAFHLLLEESGKDKRHLEAAKLLSRAAGAEGMVAGQSADLMCEGASADEEQLRFIYEHKTGKLIQAPVAMAACLAGKCQAEMSSFGADLGVLFQLTDDILDVKGENSAMGKTLGKDEAEEKLTCVRLFGLERSEQLADEYANKCLSALKNVEHADFLRELVTFVRTRNH